MLSFPLEFFPHQEVRESQRQLVQDFDVACREQKILLAHAPTGLGKTACALSVALWHARQLQKKVFFLTNRHTQHRMAVETLKLLQEKTKTTISSVDLIGKRWMCNQEVAGLFGNDFLEYCKSVVERGECEFYNKMYLPNKNLSVEAKNALQKLRVKGSFHNEDLIAFSQEEGLCSYELSLALARKAEVLIGDYSCLFHPFIRNALLKKTGMQLQDILVIVDEGHNLPSRTAEMLSGFLTLTMLKNGAQEAKKYGYTDIEHWLQEIHNTLFLLHQNSLKKEQLVGRLAFLEKINVIVPYSELLARLSVAAEEVREKQKKSFLGGIHTFLDLWQGEDEGFTRILTEHQGRQGSSVVLQYLCLDPGRATREVFSAIHAGMLMSGTLKPMSMFSDLLGIERKMEKEYPSPFPPENKLTLIIPETSTKYALRSEEMYRNIAERCSTLAAAIPGNVAFFFPSYALRDRIVMFMQTSKKRFWEKNGMSKEEKEFLLSEFKAGRETGGILLGVAGANFAEGVDFPGDLLQGVVVVGLPLGKPDLKQQELIAHYQKKFNKGWEYGYIFPAMSKCIQSAGRCIRSETDRGIIVFLDERFAWPQYFSCFSDRVGLKVTKKYLEMIREFLEKGNSG